MAMSIIHAAFVALLTLGSSLCEPTGPSARGRHSVNVKFFFVMFFLILVLLSACLSVCTVSSVVVCLVNYLLLLNKSFSFVLENK
jgi:hypothetical protein